MIKKKFEQYLHSATRETVAFTKQVCLNEVADAYKYLLVPNVRTADAHLNDRELAVLNMLNKYEHKLLGAAEVVELLWHDGLVPLWIDISVCQANGKHTTIELLCSRRLRDEEAMYQNNNFPPFHPVAPMPPGWQAPEKIDVNWRRKREGASYVRAFRSWWKGLFS